MVTHEEYERHRTHLRQRIPIAPSHKKLRELLLVIEFRVITTLTGIPFETLRNICYRPTTKAITRKHAAMIHHLHKNLFKVIRTTEKLRNTMRKF